MEQFKRAKVIMLPTENEASIIITPSTKKLSLTKNTGLTNYPIKYYINLGFIPQNLYIISDDEIKANDWFTTFTHIHGYRVKKCKEIKDHIITCTDNELIQVDYKCNKIITTTDNLLNKYCWNCNLLKEKATGLCIRCNRFGDTKRFIPQPSHQFITKYIEEYNKGNIITNVLVEYEDYNHYHINYNPDGKSIKNASTTWKIRLKINPKDNTITIKKLKDNWNREEVSNLLNKLFDDTINYSKVFELNNWINENL